MPQRPLEDWEDPEPDDDERDDGDVDGPDGDDSDLYQCPNCGAGVYEDCERCPACGDYITPKPRATHASSGRWFVGAVVLMIAIMLLAVVLSR
jgi:hypothetical protein